jgi:16S rRNA (adenine1518-N6/adenine1519-N6)-dimethyltransferase
LSVLLQAYTDVSLVMRVKPGAFLPPPRVESALLRLRPRKPAPALPWSERHAFTHLVRQVFNERRKVLRNTLRKFYGLDPEALARCEAAAALDFGRRPESLEVDEFVRLLHVLPGSTRSGAEV